MIIYERIVRSMAEKQYVVFKLDEGEFGIDIMNVKEIIPYEDSINIPNTPKFIKGVINHRGSVIPIVNLKERFNMQTLEIGKDTRIIIINLDGKEIGFIVDAASETLRLSEDNIETAPSMISGIDRKYLIGMGKIDEKRLLILIDLEKILTEEEIDEINSIEV